jgi:hypothetical protein
VLGVLNRWLGWNEPSRFTATLWLVRGFVLLTSIAALVLCCALAWRWFGERRAVWWSATALVASYGFWAYSVVPDFYVPGLASVLAAVAMLEGFQERERLWWLVGAVVFGWIAALCHQSYAAVLAVMVAVLAWERRWKAAAVAALGSAVLLLGSYVVAYHSQREYAGFWRFVLGHARYMQFTPYDRLQPLTPLYAAVGAFRAWTFPEYFVRVDAVWEWVQQRWSMKLLLDERFLLRAISPEWAALWVEQGLWEVREQPCSLGMLCGSTDGGFGGGGRSAFWWDGRWGWGCWRCCGSQARMSSGYGAARWWQCSSAGCRGGGCADCVRLSLGCSPVQRCRWCG